MDLPENIVLDQLPGPRRGKHPALYYSDDAVWSPSRRHIALAYTICEASMCNDVGCILWAKVIGNRATIIENPDGVLASCWQSPWCRWIDDESFVFKAQKYNGKTTCIPLVAIHVTKGFQVIPGTNTAEKWFGAEERVSDNWTQFDPRVLLMQIERSA
jgi:hypothetical protein